MQNIITIKGKRTIKNNDKNINYKLSNNKLSYLNNSSNLFNLRIFINKKDYIINKFEKVLDDKGIYTFIFSIINENPDESDGSIEPVIEPEENEEGEENKELEEENENN